VLQLGIEGAPQVSISGDLGVLQGCHLVRISSGQPGQGRQGARGSLALGSCEEAVTSAQTDHLDNNLL
jgi:hypothetical protein